MVPPVVPELVPPVLPAVLPELPFKLLVPVGPTEPPELPVEPLPLARELVVVPEPAPEPPEVVVAGCALLQARAPSAARAIRAAQLVWQGELMSERLAEVAATDAG